jgi:hypothetical protein
MAETIGWLTDKICVSELKIYHMKEELRREDVSLEHKKMCREKLKVLQMQRDDLKSELEGLFKETVQGKVKPKIYRQFKMYNDPRFLIATKKSN